MSFEVPPGLGDMLRNFTIAVLRRRSEGDLYEFAVEFFTKERDSRRVDADRKTQGSLRDRDFEVNGQQQKEIHDYRATAHDNMSGGDLGLPSANPGNDASADRQHQCDVKSPPKFNPKRRKSVLGDSFNPETMDEGLVNVCHPKTDAQRKSLRKTVKDIFLFRSLYNEQMEDVIDSMFEHRAEDGDYVIKQGDAGDFFYVIESGSYDVFMDTEAGTRKKIRTMDKGSFGELALLYSQPRSADVVAVKPGRLWAMDGRSFRRIVVHGTFKRLATYEHFLREVPLLANMDRWGLMNIADILIVKVYEDGDIIIREGDAADGMYFIEEGCVKVSITDQGEPKEVARLQKYDYFGELALVMKKNRSATVQAEGHVKLAFIECEHFLHLEGPCLEIMERKYELYQFSS